MGLLDNALADAGLHRHRFRLNDAEVAFLSVLGGDGDLGTDDDVVIGIDPVGTRPIEFQDIGFAVAVLPTAVPLNM